MKILVCGSRNYTDQKMVDWVLDGLYDRFGKGSFDEFCIIEGGARGADTLARVWVGKQKALGRAIVLETFDANWDAHGKAAGPIRNQKMLDVGQPHLVIAFTDDLEHSKGTGDMVRRSRLIELPVVLVERGNTNKPGQRIVLGSDA